MSTRLTIKPDGPIILSGPVEIVDPQGNRHEVPAGKVVALCRCGQSGSKPWCDGTHRACGFTANGPAPLR